MGQRCKVGPTVGKKKKKKINVIHHVNRKDKITSIDIEYYLTKFKTHS